MPHGAIEQLTVKRPDLVRLLWWATLVDEAVLRSWIVSIGRRNAFGRAAHLFCEMHLRLSHIGLVEDDSFVFPLTQEELGDALGLTPVHTNRTLTKLRNETLMTWQRGIVSIHDLRRLQDVAGFDPNYLHAGALRGPSLS